MKSRERVERAINFQEADRVPIDLGGLKASGIAVEAYCRVTRQLNLGGTPRVSDARFMIALVEEPVMQRFGGRCGARGYIHDPRPNDPPRSVGPAPPILGN